MEPGSIFGARFDAEARFLQIARGRLRQERWLRICSVNRLMTGWAIAGMTHVYAYEVNGKSLGNRGFLARKDQACTELAPAKPRIDLEGGYNSDSAHQQVGKGDAI